MITKEQYVEIIDLVQRYVVMRKKAFHQNPMTNEFAAGIEKVIDLIQILVEERLVMTREEAISFLDNTKVYVQGKSKEIQEKLFSLGFQWKFDGKKVLHKEKPFLFLWEDMELSYSSDMEHFTERAFREITANDILNIIIDEPKYRPFKNAEECWQEMQKHQPFGWITLQCGQKSGSKASIIKLTDNCFYFVGDGSGICHNLYNYEFDKHFWLFADGTPFGIKVEEE